VRFVEPHGGFFVWLELPARTDMPALLETARTAGILLQPGTRFSIAGTCAHCLRICFACHPEERICEACERLGQLLYTVIHRRTL
jgi:2-aminoadipate transaminase